MNIVRFVHEAMALVDIFAGEKSLNIFRQLRQLRSQLWYDGQYSDFTEVPHRFVVGRANANQSFTILLVTTG